jgi:hypothetical protein
VRAWFVSREDFEGEDVVADMDVAAEAKSAVVRKARTRGHFG